MTVSARVLFLASSGAGKTNAAFNMAFKHLRCFERAYIVARDLDEPFYTSLRERPDQWSNNPRSPLEVIETDELDDFEPLLRELESELRIDRRLRSRQSVCIFDDLLGEKLPKSVFAAFNRGRKLGLSCFFLNSSLADTSKLIRNNINYVCMLHLDIERDAARILQAYSVPKAVIDLYLRITAVPGNWMMIDNTEAAKKNPSLRLRHNYTPIGNMPVALKKGPATTVSDSDSDDE